MPQWRVFLERFRPAGTPGAAAQGGVPADRIADTAAELEPVFTMLDDARAEAARIRRCAVEHADAIRQDAGRQAAEIVAEARAQAEVARAEAAARSRALAVTEGTGMAVERIASSKNCGTGCSSMPDYPTAWWPRLERCWRSSANRRVCRAMRRPPGDQHRFGGRKLPAKAILDRRIGRHALVNWSLRVAGPS